MTNEDFARLSRVFNAGCDLRTTQDYRINEWLKGRLSETACACRTGGAIDKDPDCTNPLHA